MRYMILIYGDPAIYATQTKEEIEAEYSVEMADWVQIELLYGALAQIAPSPIVDLNRAVAIAMAYDIEQGIIQLEALANISTLQNYHPYDVCHPSRFISAGRAHSGRKKRVCTRHWVVSE